MATETPQAELDFLRNQIIANAALYYRVSPANCDVITARKPIQPNTNTITITEDNDDNNDGEDDEPEASTAPTGKKRHAGAGGGRKAGAKRMKMGKGWKGKGKGRTKGATVVVDVAEEADDVVQTFEYTAFLVSRDVGNSRTRYCIRMESCDCNTRGEALEELLLAMEDRVMYFVQGEAVLGEDGGS